MLLKSVTCPFDSNLKRYIIQTIAKSVPLWGQRPAEACAASGDVIVAQHRNSGSGGIPIGGLTFTVITVSVQRLE